MTDRNTGLAPHPMHNRYLYAAVFASGMCTLAIELSASRLLGNVFGTSNLVWANVIGLVLLYLTIGYFIGGWWADRSPQYTTLYKIIMWGAFLSALVPLAARPVLFAASRAVIDLQAGVVVGSFLSILALLSLPVVLLGMVSPFAIRLAVTNLNDAGRVSGRIYAVSTLGSLLGTFLPTLLLIPLLGTNQTFLIFAGVLFLVGLVGLWQHLGRRSLRYAWMPTLIVFVVGLTGGTEQTRAAISEDFKILHEGESGYNYIQVQEHTPSGTRYLFLNEGQGIHSQWHPDDIVYTRTWSFFLTAPYFNAPSHAPADVESLAVVGLAAGTIPRQHIAVYGDIPIDGIEIDPEIVDAGAAYFDMNAAQMPSLTVHVEDGRYGLRRLERDYSVIALDAYRPPYIPWHLTTVEFFEEVRDRLTDDGVVAVNVGRTTTDRRLVEAMSATLLEVFPTVHTMDVPATFNTILVATQQPTTSDNLSQNLSALPADDYPLLTQALQSGVDSLVPTVSSDIVFTDNHAPVELLVDSIVLNFLVNGEVESLR